MDMIGVMVISGLILQFLEADCHLVILLNLVSPGYIQVTVIMGL